MHLEDMPGFGEPGEESVEHSVSSPLERLFEFTQNSLGFTEDQQMQLIRHQACAIALVDDETQDQFRILTTKYQSLASEPIDHIADLQERARAQIGLIVASAYIYHSANKPESYREAIQDALVYADNMGFEDVVRELKELELEIFKDSFEQGIEELLEMSDLLLDEPRPLDPYSMGFDDRIFEELSEAEKTIAQQVVYNKFGLNPQDRSKDLVREYSLTDEDSPDSDPIQVAVYRTNRQDDGLYLYELTFTDNQRRWMVGVE